MTGPLSRVITSRSLSIEVLKKIKSMHDVVDCAAQT